MRKRGNEFLADLYRTADVPRVHTRIEKIINEPEPIFPAPAWSLFRQIDFVIASSLQAFALKLFVCGSKFKEFR